MFDYQDLLSRLQDRQAHRWSDILAEQVSQAYRQSKHGDYPRWLKTIRNLPDLKAASVILDQAKVSAQTHMPLDTVAQHELQRMLMQLHPWRKGPYDLFGIHIDTEWRSDLKWERICEHIQPLKNRFVMDVGCGNGYHCWRMLGAGADTVVGVDPTLLSVMQFNAVKKFLGQQAAYVLPIGVEDVPKGLKVFDSVFSMGVLYHRRSPMDHLFELRDMLRPGGELILETLVIEGDDQQVLLPPARYAKMRNVWFIPSCDTLIAWMQRCGLKNARLINVEKTAVTEQRSTEWMQFHSLADFLDPENSSLTVEGLPAPVRAVFLAEAP